jgi:hypothetical protein
MREYNHIGIATEELYRIFEILNQHYWNNELPTPTITIQKSPRGNFMGWMTLNQVWINKETGEKSYELNICPEIFNLPVIDVVATTQHEIVHLYHLVHEIKDCSGKKHNKKFVKMAEEKDLIVASNTTKGCHTDPTPKFNQFVDEHIKPDENCFKYFRELPPKKEKGEGKNKTYRYVCPQCKEEVRAKSDEAIIKCGKCSCDFELTRGRKKKDQ